MRRVLTILATCAMLAGPAPTFAEDPFDFSDWNRKPTPSDWSSQETPRANAASPASGQPRSRQTSRIKNYGAELFSDADPQSSVEPDSRSKTTRQRPENPLDDGTELPMPPGAKQRITRDDLYVRDTDDTLDRFNDFLKAREVTTAAYDSEDEPIGNGEIQTVAGERETTSPWGITPQTKSQPSRTDTFSPSGTNGSRENGANSRFSFMEAGEPQAIGARPRLTDPISTSREVPAVGPRDTQAPDLTTDVNPFEVSQPPAQQERTFVERQTVPSRTVDTTDFGQLPVQPSSESRITALPTSQAATRLSSQSSHTHASDAAPAVTAVWKPLAALNVGQECPCELVVTNEGKSVAERVSIEAQLPESVRITDSNPAPVDQKAFLGWRLDNLQPNETRIIKVTIVPTQPGPVDASAQVRYTSSNVQSLTVAEPQLNVVVTGPAEISVGEPASQTVTVRNPGTGVATNIKLEALIPAGLEHVQGERLLMNIGSLNPGETRRMRLALAAVSGGPQIIQVRAEADAGLVHTASAEINVIAPSLKATIDGPGLRYLGREAVFTLSVTNDGGAASDNVQVMHRIPEGFEFVQSDRGAKYDKSTRMLNWFVGRLSPEQPQELRVTLMASKAGEFTQAVRATSEHGSYCDASLQTRVEGTASLVVKVADLDDPVEISSETAYEITITNEGTASASMVGLSCELPAGLELLKADGPTPHRTEAGGVMFQPLSEVRAGESHIYQVFVKGQSPGDKRFRCRLTSDALSQPLFTEELTKFYGE